MLNSSTTTRIHRAMAFAAAVSLGGVASAANWEAVSGNYGDPLNWDSSVPVAGEDAFINNGGEALIGDSGSYEAANLYLSTQGTSVTGSRLELSDGTLAVSSWVRTGNGSDLTINGGTLNASNIIVGQFSSDFNESFLNLSSGTINLSTGGMLIGRNDAGTVNISGGEIVGGNLYVGSGSTTLGVVNHSAGTVTSRIRGSENNAGGYGPGIYNLSGTGVLTADTRISIGHQAYGEFNVSGGTLTSGGATTQVGDQAGGDGLLNISGGDVNLISGLQLGNSATGGQGTLRVQGAAADITMTGSGISASSNSVLNFVIDAGGISPIVLDVGGNNATYIDGELDIDLASGFIPTEGQSFDLILNAATRNGTLTAFPGRTFTNGYDITAMTLAAEDVGVWTYEVVADGVGDYNVLRATYVPEPAGVALLGLAVPALLRRRRR